MLPPFTRGIDQPKLLKCSTLIFCDIVHVYVHHFPNNKVYISLRSVYICLRSLSQRPPHSGLSEIEAPRSLQNWSEVSDGLSTSCVTCVTCSTSVLVFTSVPCWRRFASNHPAESTMKECAKYKKCKCPGPEPFISLRCIISSDKSSAYASYAYVGA